MKQAASRQETATVVSNRQLGSGVHLLWLESEQIAATAKPGQFVMLRCGQGLEHMLRRPLSIHQTDGARLALLINVVGEGTHWTSHREAGETLDLLGPLGNGFAVYPGTRRSLVIAGGMGIAPLCFLMERLVQDKGAVTLLYGTAGRDRHPAEMFPAGIDVVAATEDGSVGYRGLVTDLVPRFVGPADQVFVCGPVPMYRSIASNRRKLKLEGKPVQVSLEERMGCGHGACYSCAIKTRHGLRQVCRDGPVFDLDDILWDNLDASI